jgi:copper chaperone CopZ
MQVLLSSPEITCEHCIETIRGVVDGSEAARFMAGDPDARTFVLEIGSGAALDRLAVSLAEAGYPLGAIETSEGDAHPRLTADWRPASYRVEKTAVGANVNYDCYCGCDAGFALDRSQADQATESCCCGNHMLVGAGAAERILAKLDDAAQYRVDVQQATMPWGQPVDVALAIPLGG